MKTIFYVFGIFGFLIVGSCGSDDIGKIIFLVPKDDSIVSEDKAHKLKEDVRQKDVRLIDNERFLNIFTVVNQTKPRAIVFLVYFDGPIGATKLRFQLVDNFTGAIYFQSEWDMNPENESLSWVTDLRVLPDETGKPLPTELVFLVIKKDEVIGRGVLRVLTGKNRG